MRNMLWSSLCLAAVALNTFGCEGGFADIPTHQNQRALSDTGTSAPPKTVEETLFPIRVSRALINQNRFAALNKTWPLSVNKGLVLAVSGHADLYSLSGTSATQLENFALSLFESQHYTAFEDTRQFAQVVYDIQGADSFKTLRSVFVASTGYMMKFDAQGTLWAYHPERNGHVAIDLGHLESTDYDWLSRGLAATEFTVGESPFVWRYFFHPQLNLPLGVLVTPKGGKHGGETELALLDFQSPSGSPINPVEHYLGTRSEGGLRVDHTMVFPQGISLRSISNSGVQQRIFYRGIFRNFLSGERVRPDGTVNSQLAIYDVEPEPLVPEVAPDFSWTYLE